MRPSSPAARRLLRLARHPRRHVVTSVARVHRSIDAPGVALTFDDGPKPGSTDRVLDVLAEFGVTATFFCVGRNALDHPALIHRIDREGHAVGSHSFSHPHPAQTSLRDLAREYRQGRQAVSEVLGRDTALFRPPNGHISPGAAALLRAQGLDVWLWNVDPEDWRPGARQDRIEADAGQAPSGGVVLLHDWIEQPWAPEALDRSATIGALPGVVADVRRRGLSFAPVAVSAPR